MDVENEKFTDLGDSQRCTGRTTRMCDDIIQRLFANVGNKVLVSDHWYGRCADEMLANKVIRRLELEHPMVHATVSRDNSRIYISIQYERLKGGVK